MPTKRSVTSVRPNLHYPWAKPKSGRHGTTFRELQEGSSQLGKMSKPLDVTTTEDDEDPGEWFMWNSHPRIQDPLQTATSATQDETVELLMSFLDRDEGLPSLEREKHIEYLHACLGTLPSMMVVLDASRPWQIYWTLAGLALLGEDITQYRSRYTSAEA